MFRKVSLMLSLLLVVSFGFAGSAASQNADETTDVYTLGEIVVSGSRPGVEAASTHREITAREIEARNVKTLDKALELLPGVFISSRAQGIPRVDIRGMRSRHVLLLLNGIPLNSTSDGQFNPAIIGTDNIAKIKVSYGGSSVLYGQGALGGVINIITKKGKEGIHGSVSGEIDERGNNLKRLSLSGGTKKFDALFSGSFGNSDGYRLSEDFSTTPYEDGGIRENSDNKRENVFGNAGYAFNDAWKIGVTAENSSGRFGSPPSTIDNTIDPIFGKKPKYLRVEDYEGASRQFSAAYNPESPFAMRAWVFSNRYKEKSASYDSATYITFTKKGNYRTDDETKVSGGNVQCSYDFGKVGRLTGSFATEDDEFDTVGATSSKNNKPLDTPYNEQYKLDMHSVAMEYDNLLFSRLKIVMGYSHFWQDRELGDDEDMGSTLLGASYQASDSVTIRGSFSKKVRFPSLSQLYAIGEGNAALKPEQSTNYELGAAFQLPWDLTFDLAGFWNDVKYYIEKDASGINQNQDHYRFQGIELSLSAPFLETGVARMGYGFLNSENRSPGTLTETLQYRPKHKFTFECDYTWSFGLSAHAGYMYVADQYAISGAFTKKLKDYDVVDVKLSQRIIKDRLFAYIGATNLFDKNYEQSYGFPQAGRIAYAGMKLVF